MKHIVYAAGMLYQHIPLNASITFEAGMLAPVIGDESSFPGVSGARRGSISEISGIPDNVIDNVSGADWSTI